MKKSLYILGLIFMCFFIDLNKVGAVQIDKDAIVFTCEYATKDGNYAASHKIYKSAASGQQKNISHDEFKKVVTITKFNGQSGTNTERDQSSVDIASKTIATLECPKYLVIYKDNGYNAISYDSKTNAEKKLGTRKGAILPLISDYYEMNKGLSSFNELQVKEHSCTSWSTGFGAKCSNWVPETSYTCDYGNGLSRTFLKNYSSAIANLSDPTNYPVSDNKCPTIIYEIISGSEKYYKTFGSWPSVCDGKKVKCYKYIYGAGKEEFKKGTTDTKVEEFESKTYTYAKYKNLLTQEQDMENTLSLKISGKTDGTISNIDITISGKKVAIGNIDESKFESYFTNYAKLGGISDLPKYWSCGSKAEAESFGYVISNTFPGLESADIVCTNENFGIENKIGSPNFTTYLLVDDDKLSQSIKYDIKTIKDINANLEKNYKKSICKTSPKSSECDKYQKELYGKIEQIIKECKGVYSSLGASSSDIGECDTFYSKLSNWSEKGYFGKYVINSTSTGCKATLGSLAGWLKKIYNILLLAVPVLIMIFGFKDFMKAVLNGKEDELKKAGTTFIKRLIFGAVFVALPVLISLVINLAFGKGFADICIF